MLLSLPSSREEDEQSDEARATIRWRGKETKKRKKDDVEKWHGRLRLFKRERRARRKCILIPSASTINTQRVLRLVQMRLYSRRRVL